MLRTETCGVYEDGWHKRLVPQIWLQGSYLHMPPGDRPFTRPQFALGLR